MSLRPPVLLLVTALGLAPSTVASQVNEIVVPARVGVVVFAPDDLPNGVLQRALENGVASHFDDVEDLAIEIVPSGVLAGMLAPAAPGLDADAFEDSIEEVRKACIAAEWDRARSILASLSKTVSALDPVPAHAMARIRLFASFIEWKSNGPAKARSATRLALDLVPNLQAGTSVFPPGFATFVDDERKTRGTPIPVVVQGLPRGAAVVVRGHGYEPELVLSPGTHTLELRIPGAKPIRRKVDTRKARGTLFVELQESAVLDLDARWEALEQKDTIASIFEGLAATLAVDWLAYAVLLPDGGAETGIVPAKGSLVRVSPVSGSGDDASVEELRDTLIGLLARDLESSMRSGARATAPMPDLLLSRSSSSPAGEGISLGVGSFVTSRRRSLAGSGGADFDADFLGTGISAFYVLQGGPLWLRGTFGFASFGSSTAEIDLPDGEQARARGGDSAQYGIHAGYRVRKSRSWSPSLWLIAGFSLETHWARDARMPGDAHLKILPSYETTALDIGFRSSIHSRRGSPWRFGIEATAQPLSDFEKKPKPALGSSPEFDVGWRAGVEVTRRLDRSSFALSWNTSHWGARFDGTADAELDPAVVDARVEETSHTVALTWQYGF